MDDADCDVAYSTPTNPVGNCRFRVCANLDYWEHKSTHRMETVAQLADVAHPIFEGGSHSAQLTYYVDDCLVCQRDVIFDAFWLITGQEERYWTKNKHGHFRLPTNNFDQRDVLGRALASSIGTWLEKILMRLGHDAIFPRWPQGKRAASCVGHDVDYPEVIRWLEPLRVVRREGIRGMPAAAAVLAGKRQHWHFQSWVSLESELGIRSAFYFVARQGSLLKYVAGTPNPFYDVTSDRFKKVFNYLVDEGFEIGMHASYRACESQQQFRAEKQVLEQASGQRIEGNRHHYWRLNPDDPESTLLLHEQIDLRYDTSLTHEHYVGWRRGLTWPFFPFHQGERRELRTLQISTAWMDDQLFGHRSDNPGHRAEILRALTNTVSDQGGCLLIDVHDYVFDDALFPSWTSTYRALMEDVTQRSDFWIDTPNNIARWWTKRYASILSASDGLRCGVPVS